MNSEEKYQYAIKTLKNYNNYIEIEDFRKFLLLILNLENGGPEAVLKQLGLGGKGKTVLPYDSEKKIYYNKIMSGLSMNQQLTIYVKSDKKLSDSYVNKADSDLFKNYLTEFELKNLLPKKIVVVTPEIMDCCKKSLVDDNEPKPIINGIESLYNSLGEFIATQNLKFLFLLEGKGDDADIAFSINMSFESNSDSPHQIQYFDVYVDETKMLRGKTFIQMKNEDDSLGTVLLEEIKDLSHSDLFKSHFTIIVPIKSFSEI